MIYAAHTHTMTARHVAGVEEELKFVADRKTFKAALSIPLLGGSAEAPEWLQLRSVYFDTEERRPDAS